jgi:hypothetical protein
MPLIFSTLQLILALMGEPVWATNATHPVSSKLALAQATAHRFNDHNLAWNTSGTNGHFAPFRWQP